MSFVTSNIGKVIVSKINSTVTTYAVTAPQGAAFPYAVYDTLQSDHDEVKSATWVDYVSVLIMIYDTTYAGTCTKANSVRDILNRMSGTISSVKVDSCNFVTESDDYDNDLKCYIKFCEYKFRIKI